jgi:hypothetical protein
VATTQQTENSENPKHCKTRGVSHHALAIYIEKCLNSKEELWKFKYFTNNILRKQKSSERNQNPSRHHNSITNLKFQLTVKHHLSKILI